MPERVTCDVVEAGDLLSRYVAGTLTANEAEALEAHTLECERCWSDLQMAIEARAAFTAPQVTTSPAKEESRRTALGSWRRSRRFAVLGAAAAAIVFVAIGVAWQWQQGPREAAPVLRGSGSALETEVSWSSDGSLTLDWVPQPGTATYRVLLSDPAAGLVTEETTSSSAEFPADVIRRMPHAVIRIEAMNAAGEVIGRAGPIALPRQP